MLSKNVSVTAKARKGQGTKKKLLKPATNIYIKF